MNYCVPCSLFGGSVCVGVVCFGLLCLNLIFSRGCSVFPSVG